DIKYKSSASTGVDQSVSATHHMGFLKKLIEENGEWKVCFSGYLSFTINQSFINGCY
ncbi:MAG: hypothetical protein JNK41_09040, partial [Saprospiraceae bacterium]|nr:hypothetical protein [Saprospiraceae bacterium]